MSEVLYREMTKKDYPCIKKLICEAFDFHHLTQDSQLLNYIATLYLHECITKSTYSEVAIKDNKVIGVILGNVKEEKKNFLNKINSRLSYIYTYFKLLFHNSQRKNSILKYFQAFENTYEELIAGKEMEFQGSVQLFIVSKESRGLGVGKRLLSNLLKHMKDNNVKLLYVYTDSECNYGFYEHLGFELFNQKSVYLDPVKSNVDIFLMLNNLTINCLY